MELKIQDIYIAAEAGEIATAANIANRLFGSQEIGNAYCAKVAEQMYELAQFLVIHGRSHSEAHEMHKVSRQFTEICEVMDWQENIAANRGTS